MIQQFVDRAGSLTNARRTAVGGMLVDATIARVGILEYGDVKRYNSPDVLLAALDQLTTVPVTNRHPPKFVDVDNYREFVAGHIVGTPTLVDGHIRATLAINDAALMQDIELGIAREISMGYLAEHSGPGVTDTGETFHEARAKITWNHCAVVPTGRSGRTVRVLDEDGAIPQEDEPMTKLKFNDTEVDASAAQPQIDALEATIAALTAETETLKTAKAALETELTAAKSEDALTARIAERDAKLAAEKALAEKLARVKAGYPTIDLASKSEAYIDGLDAALEARKAADPDGITQLDGTANQDAAPTSGKPAAKKIDRKAALAAERRAAAAKTLS